MIDFYLIYRLVLLGFTIYGTINFLIVIFKLLQYKEYYDRAPQFIKNYFIKKGNTIIKEQINQQQDDIVINGILLLVLVILNIILLLYK